MSLSYAGIPLTVPTEEQQAGIQAWLDSWSEFEFSGKAWPGKELVGMTFAQANWPCANPKLGTLYWPFTAMRWAVGHFVASDNQLALIRAKLPIANSQVTPVSADLVMGNENDEFESIETELFMLPPRPIHQIGGNNGLHLLTLVDERYYWWYKDAGALFINPGTIWDDLYDALATILDVDLTFDPISPNYFSPDPSFTNYYQSVPILLDAIAFNCGQRINRSLDGTLQATNNTTDLATLNFNIHEINTFAAKVLGGNFQRSWDFNYAMPGTVKNVTHVWKSSVPTVLAPLYHAQPVKLVEQSGFNGLAGFDGTKTFLDTFHGTEASAFANEAALAQQIATDYWLRLWNGFLDITLAHALNVEPEGLHDIEWSHKIDSVSTRIMRPTWNWEPDQLLHGDGNGPFSGNSANEPWQVQPFFAQVSSPVGTAYPWTEVIPATGGTWSAKPSGRSGTDSLNPGYEFNASTTVSGGSIVLMWRGFQNAASTKQEWLFAVAASGGSSSLTVEDSGEENICTGITTIICDSASMAVECGPGGGQVTISALSGEDIYIIYLDHGLTTIPCIDGVPPIETLPFPAPTIATMKTKPGLDFQSSLSTIGTNPTTGGGGGTIINNCVPALPPPAGYYCHRNPGGNNCSTSPYPVTGDTSVTGPYPDSATCTAVCTGSTPPAGNKMYSETPGITWDAKLQTVPAGDTGPCTHVLKASVTFPPPNAGTLTNSQRPGQGTNYPINWKDSCTVTILTVVDDTCQTIDITSNWNGLTVYGGSDCPYPDCSAAEDLLAQANALVFSRCDFKVTDVGTSCPPLRAVKVQTCGLTQTTIFNFLKSDCTTGTFTIKVLDGLVREMTVT